MSDEHKWRRKCFVICLLALFIGLMGIVLPEQEDIAFEYIVNNTDLYNNGRITGTTYTANDSAIQLFLIFHVVGTGASLVVDTNLSINGTVVEDRDYRTTAGAGIHEHFSMTAHIPKGANYSVTNSSNLETIEWREYPILTGRNGTLSINMTGGTGNQNLSQVLIQGNSAGTNNINMNENYIYNVSSIYEDHGNNQTYTRWDASTPVIISRVSKSPYINFIEMYPNYTYFSKGMTIAGDVTMDNSHTNYTNTGKWLKIGYNDDTGLMDINTSSIFYYKQGNSYLASMGSGFALTTNDNIPVKYGWSGQNNSQIMYNLTYGTRWMGFGTANKNLNITSFDKVNMYQNLFMESNSMIYINNQSIDKLMLRYKVPSNTTWVNISGLNISRDGFYDVTSQLTCRNATNLKMYINGDVNDSNYTRQFVYADGGTTISARQNDAGISACSAGKSSTGKQRVILDAYNKTHYISEVGLSSGGFLIFFNGMYSYNNDVTNVNSIHLYADVANSIGYGSEFWIYRS